MRARKEQKDGFLTLLALINISTLRKAIARAERGYNRMDHMDKHC